ncbi:MAG: Fic family protein [Spirochaetales bacterium]|nr:Fic family protein [Spirochaetales bacterium]
MRLEEFLAGLYTQEFHYQAFLPSSINHQWYWDDPEINVLLDEANRLLGEINAFSFFIPNIELFIKMHIVKESNESNRIEGTRTEIDEALMEEGEINPERRDDWKKVHQYIVAMNASIALLEQLPISNRLIREAHKVIMATVRGENKTPGEFRRSQNWIGGANLSVARYIPPHDRFLADLMGDLESFINNEKLQIPHLVKIAIVHYAFETIHPFLDGNGRVGRLLITLYLVGSEVLSRPVLYLSDFLEKNRDEYYSRLSKVREENDISQWIKFFIRGVIATAESTKGTFVRIIDLQSEISALLPKFGRRSDKINLIINTFYEFPIMNIKDLVERTGIPDKTMRNLIFLMEESLLIKEFTGSQRNKLYIFDKYVKIFV